MNTATIDLPSYRLKVTERADFSLRPAPRVYVANDIASGRSDLLADLERQERELGDNRFADREAVREVDELYDRLNAEIMRVKTEIATEALRQVTDYVSGDMDRAADRAFFSRNAGCDDCPCTPGVVAGAKLTWDDFGGMLFDVDVVKL